MSDKVAPQWFGSDYEIREHLRKQHPHWSPGGPDKPSRPLTDEELVAVREEFGEGFSLDRIHDFEHSQHPLWHNHKPTRWKGVLLWLACGWWLWLPLGFAGVEQLSRFVLGLEHDARNDGSVIAWIPLAILTLYVLFGIAAVWKASQSRHEP